MIALLFAAAPALAGSIESLPSVSGAGEGQPLLHAQPAGDLDGDGLGDMAFGAPYDDNDGGHEAGAVWILYGEGYPSVDRWTPIGDVAVGLTGYTSQEHAGYDVAAVGDVNGDGYGELTVGAPEASADSPTVGKVYLVYGSGEGYGDGSLADHPYFHGTEQFAHAGARVYPAGDLDGDGLNEILIGTPWPTANGTPGIGYLAMFYGREGGWGDTWPILANYSSNEAAQTTTADAVFLVYASETYASRSATVVPDVDGDGHAELLLGAPGYTDSSAMAMAETGGGAPPPHGGIGPDEPDYVHTHTLDRGAAYLFPGRDRPAVVVSPFQTEDEAIGVINGAETGDMLPWVLATLNDGRVLMTSPDALQTAGEVYLFRDLEGTLTPDDAETVWQGSSAGELLGWSAAPVDGIDGDGILAALGEPGWDAGAGRVTLVDETSGLVETAALETLRGCWPDGLVGWSVRAHPGPDPYGNDTPWVGITAPGASVYADGDGLAYILTADALATLGEECDLPDVAPTVDADEDGYVLEDDCDDEASWIFPGADEVCSDGVDDDCDGEIDESCGPALEEGCGGCASATPAGGPGAAWLLPALLLGAALRRRSRDKDAPEAGLSDYKLRTTNYRLLLALLLAPAARAQDDEARPLARIWGSAAEEYLQGPVVSGDFDADGQPDLAVANYRGFAYYYAPGEIFLITHEGATGDIYLADVRNTIYGATEHDYLGRSVAVMLDDVGEADDLLVGQTFAGLTAREPGQALLFTDPLLGSSVVAADQAQVTLGGDDNADWMGEQVVVSRDLDGDGLDDAAVSAPIRDVADQSRMGSVFIFHDDLRELEGDFTAANTATTTINGAGPASWAGWRVLGPGDIDGDGYGDLVVGSMPSGNFAGQLHVFLGVPRDKDLTTDDADGTWTVSTPNAYLGFGLDGGDLDGDGLAEVVASSYTVNQGGGRVWLLDGPPGGTADVDQAARATFEGEAGSGTGYSVAVGPSLLVGAPYASTVFALDDGLQVLGYTEGEGDLGHWVGWVDDMNGDTTADAVVVAPSASGELEQQGLALLISGRDAGSGAFPGAGGSVMDADNDGVLAGEDCDDSDPRLYPGAQEICRDDLDNDCDGATDEKDDCVRGGCSTAPANLTPGSAGAFWLLALAAILRRRRC